MQSLRAERTIPTLPVFVLEVRSVCLNRIAAVLYPGSHITDVVSLFIF